MLPAIISTLHWYGQAPIKMLAFSEWTEAELLYNFDFLHKADMYLQYSNVLRAIEKHAIHHDSKQWIMFMKKFLSAITQTALDMVFDAKSDAASLASLRDLTLFNISREQSIKQKFLDNIDDQAIWSQHEKLSNTIDELPQLTQTFVYFTAQKWSTIDFSKTIA